MRPLPEGVTGYPRWEGMLSSRPALWVIAEEEIRNAWEGTWSRFAILLVVAWTVIYIGALQAVSGGNPNALTTDGAVAFLDQLRWAALVLAAVVGGPSLLEDDRRGALELYYARAVTKRDYLGGKVLALLGLTFASLVVPAFLYWGSTYVIFSKHPPGWNLWFLKSLVYSAAWVLPVAGLGMGLSCVSGSSRAATLILFGGVAGMDLIVSNLLSALTNMKSLHILSPFTAHHALAFAIFGDDVTKVAFPTWWGVLELLVLAAVGWGLVAWKHPRLRGVD